MSKIMESCCELQEYDATRAYFHLFDKMETERAKIPNIIREDYVPIFIVSCLNEKLSGDDSETFSCLNRQLDFLAEKSRDLAWEENTLLEEKPDFEGQFLLSSEKLQEVGKILHFAQDVLENFNFDKRKLAQCFADGCKYPCVELLYLMDVKYGLAPLNGYMLRLTESSQINHFKSQFLCFCLSTDAFTFENRERSIKILGHFLKRILLTHYCNPGNKPELLSAKKLTGEILSFITSKLVCDDSTKLNSMNHRILLEAFVNMNVSSSVKIRMFVEHIKMILQSGVQNFRVPEKILQCQEELADPGKLIELERFRKTMSEIIRCILGENDVLNIISSVVTPSDVNWVAVLNFTSVWLQEKEKCAGTMMRDLVKSLIQSGLIEKNGNGVMTGFILARHSSLVAPDSFFRYEKWFSNLFESEKYSPANEPATFEFLVNILTQWVPTEPSCFLRVHTTFGPFVPKGCRSIWIDYVQLAKARISECSQMENAIEHEPNENDPVQHQVATAVRSYEAKGNIPESIIKMAIFSRHEYLNSFLPALLRKPTGVVLTDSRLRLIEHLNKQQKIPPDMYAKYKQSLRKS